MTLDRERVDMSQERVSRRIFLMFLIHLIMLLVMSLFSPLLPIYMLHFLFLASNIYLIIWIIVFDLCIPHDSPIYALFELRSCKSQPQISNLDLVFQNWYL